MVMKQLVGQPVCLKTRRGLEVGIVERVSADGITLRAVPDGDRAALRRKMFGSVRWGEGFYPWSDVSGFSSSNGGGGWSSGSGGSWGGGFGGLF